MAVGILIGHSIPQIPAILGSMEIAGISIPIAVLIWIMIYPMMIKVDFQSVREVGRNPKGLFVTWITNWLIKPFTMYFIAYVFLYDVFASFMTPELARQYLARRLSFWVQHMHGHGFCLEHADPWESGIYGSSGSYE